MPLAADISPCATLPHPPPSNGNDPPSSPRGSVYRWFLLRILKRSKLHPRQSSDEDLRCPPNPSSYPSVYPGGDGDLYTHDYGCPYGAFSEDDNCPYLCYSDTSSSSPGKYLNHSPTKFHFQSSQGSQVSPTEEDSGGGCCCCPRQIGYPPWAAAIHKSLSPSRLHSFSVQSQYDSKQSLPANYSSNSLRRRFLRRSRAKSRSVVALNSVSCNVPSASTSASQRYQHKKRRDHEFEVCSCGHISFLPLRGLHDRQFSGGSLVHRPWSPQVLDSKHSSEPPVLRSSASAPCFISESAASGLDAEDTPALKTAVTQLLQREGVLQQQQQQQLSARSLWTEGIKTSSTATPKGLAKWDSIGVLYGKELILVREKVHQRLLRILETRRKSSNKCPVEARKGVLRDSLTFKATEQQQDKGLDLAQSLTQDSFISKSVSYHHVSDEGSGAVRPSTLECKSLDVICQSCEELTDSTSCCACFITFFKQVCRSTNHSR